MTKYKEYINSLSDQRCRISPSTGVQSAIIIFTVKYTDMEAFPPDGKAAERRSALRRRRPVPFALQTKSGAVPQL